MRSLDVITDWAERGREAGYNWKRLARNCSISPRTLHEYFQAIFRYPPQEWLNQLRFFDAMALLWEGVPVKRVALELGFKQPSHFCRAFKGFTRMTPTKFMADYQIAWNRYEDEVTQGFYPKRVPKAWIPVPLWTTSVIHLQLKWRSFDGRFARAR